MLHPEPRKLPTLRARTRTHRSRQPRPLRVRPLRPLQLFFRQMRTILCACRPRSDGRGEAFLSRRLFMGATRGSQITLLSLPLELAERRRRGPDSFLSRHQVGRISCRSAGAARSPSLRGIQCATENRQPCSPRFLSYVRDLVPIKSFRLKSERNEMTVTGKAAPSCSSARLGRGWRTDWT